MPPAKPVWSVRGFQDGDEHQAVPLYNRIFHKHMSKAEYRWKVVDTPWPPGAPTTWLADAGGVIAGQYASTAMRFWLHGREWPVVHVCDVMTHPDYRRQGILSALGEAAHRAWADAGVAFVTGFPHKGWGSRSRYLNWQTMYQGIWMWRPLNVAAFLPRPLGLLRPPARLADRLFHAAIKIRATGSAKGVYIEEARQAGEAFDHLWLQLRAEFPALVVRDAAWLNHRYLQAPMKDYRLFTAVVDGQLCGYAVQRIRRLGDIRVAYLADLFCSPHNRQVQNALLQHLIEVSRSEGARAMLAVLPERSPFLAAYRRCGFLRRYGSFDVSIVQLNEQLDYDPLRDSRQWYSCGGDFDIV
jgi:GNAT superfamily N-acetyltransferase